jgi:hypothetical protein
MKLREKEPKLWVLHQDSVLSVKQFLADHNIIILEHLSYSSDFLWLLIPKLIPKNQIDNIPKSLKIFKRCDSKNGKNDRNLQQLFRK